MENQQSIPRPLLIERVVPRQHAQRDEYGEADHRRSADDTPICAPKIHSTTVTPNPHIRDSAEDGGPISSSALRRYGRLRRVLQLRRVERVHHDGRDEDGEDAARTTP